MAAQLILLFAGLSGGILVVAAWLMLRVSGRDLELAARVEAAHGRWAAPVPGAGKRAAGRGLVIGLKTAVSGIGAIVMNSGVLPGRTRTELQSTLSAAGLRGPNSMALFVGSKLATLLVVPLAAYLVSEYLELAATTRFAFVGGLAIFGLIAPDMVIKRRRAAYLKSLDDGLSDALDLMVICAQAGLSLEPAMARVAVELRTVHPAICTEFASTVRELEIMSDSPSALANLGRRTGLESLTRLASTLTQTMQYGTPLTDSLRTLSNEMRSSALTRFEERAARLPVLLTLPMILFILPCVFMIVGGPAAIQIGRSLSGQ